MRIASLQLINFKSYRNQKFEFPPPRGNKNIILIGGLNGYGKTSFLEALYLSLYGSEAMRYLGRAGLKINKDVTYGKFLSRAFNHDADPDSPMSVSIEFIDDQNNGYRVSRSWYFDRNRKWDGDDTDKKIYSIENGVPRKPISSDYLPQILDEHFVVPNLAPFFFFDGEEVKSLAARDKVEQVKLAIDNFLGIVTLRELQSRLRDYQNVRRRGISQVDETRLSTLEDTIQSLEEGIARLHEKKYELEELRENIEQEWQAVQDRMLTLGGSDGSIASIRTLATEINEHQQKLQQARSELIDMLCKKLSINLISNRTVNTFLDQIRKEQATRKWQHECIALKPQREKFLSSFFSHDQYVPPLSASQKSQLCEAINSAWESLFSPPPANCTLHPIHTYLSDDMINQVHNMYNHSSIGSREISSKFDEVDVIKKRLESWRMQMAKLEGLDHTGEIVERIKQQMKDITIKRDKCLNDLSNTNNKLFSDKAELDKLNAEYSRENKRFLENAPTNSLLHKAEKIYHFIDKLINALYKIKIEQIGEEISHVFRELSHKHQVKKITLESDATARIWGYDDQELDFDKSAGESQLFATSLLAALANVSGADAPLVVDTPLGRLDSLHRKNILNFWTQNSDRQVILLSQDKEIDPEQYQKLKPFILKSYTLEYVDMGNGVGQTTVHPGYFGDHHDAAAHY